MHSRLCQLSGRLRRLPTYAREVSYRARRSCSHSRRDAQLILGNSDTWFTNLGMCWRELELDLDEIENDLKRSEVSIDPNGTDYWLTRYGQAWHDAVPMTSPYRLSHRELADYITLGGDVILHRLCMQPEQQLCETVADYEEGCEHTRSMALDRAICGLPRMEELRCSLSAELVL